MAVRLPSPSPELIAVVGPTASGKTHRAVELARELDSEIISGDSRQVYRGMTIGTGKDIDEYGDVPVHLIDICEAGEKYNLFRYLKDFRNAFDDVSRRGHIPVLCGGSGMYVEAAISGIALPDVPINEQLRLELEEKSLPELTEILGSMKTLHNVTDIDTKKRAIRAIEIQHYYQTHPEEALQTDRSFAKPIETLLIGIDVPRDIRRKRISMRLHQRLDEGMIEEVKGLLASGIAAEDLIYYGLEYKFLTLYILGRLDYSEMVNKLEIAIHQFAKRQMTWLRGMERRGYRIHWHPYDRPISDSFC